MSRNMSRFKILIIISWLWIRLKMTLERSRLMIFRMLPKAESHVVSFDTKSLPSTTWTFEGNRASCLNYEKEDNAFNILLLHPVSEN